MRTLLIFILISVFSCKPIEKATVKETVQKPIIFTELSTGTNGNFSEKTNKVITNQTDFNAIWNAAYERYAQQPKPLRIDFENKMVILVAMGIKNSGGYNTKVKSIHSGTNVVVSITETTPGASCATSDVMTFPYQIIEMEKTTKKVVFETVTETYQCEE